MFVAGIFSALGWLIVVVAVVLIGFGILLGKSRR